MDGLSAVGEKGDARSKDLQNLAAQEDALLGVDDESTVPFEREVGIRAKAALSVGEELHVPIELPSEVESKAGYERLRILRFESGHAAQIERHNRIAVVRCSRRCAELRDDK